MPPKPKYTREQMIESAYELVRESGADALTAREAGKRMGVSSSPIFTMFEDMGELRAAVRERAKVRFSQYMAVAEAYTPAYKKRGMQWVKFACEEPNLFRLLFMIGNGKRESFSGLMHEIPFGSERDVRIIMDDYHTDSAQAEHLFYQMWIYTYGLCVLCATGVCAFSEDEIARQLSEIFSGMMLVIKSGEKLAGQPVPKAEKDESEA